MRSTFETLLLTLAFAVTADAQSSFVNFETPPVHPLELSVDGARLFAVQTADNRLLVYDLSGDTPVLERAIPVGLDPVSVRSRPGAPNEAWVVNQLSDSVSVVNLATGHVVATLATDDEPADVVFAAAPQRAFVSCSAANTVLVFDPANVGAAPTRIAIDAEDPRALATSLDGARVYVAVFESGNGSTILGGGSTMGGGFPPNAVSDASGPYGGVNPPPNSGGSFSPPIAAGLPPPPKVGLIVKKDAAGNWMDDNAHDWTSFVSGADAAKSGRPVGWDLPDRDLAIVDAQSFAVTYATRLMNICMAVSVNPASGEVFVVGTDGTNEIRFEPVLSGTFLRVNVARVDPSGPATLDVSDLNPHLSYTTSTVPQSERDKSIGDPRGIAWNASGTRAFVTGMGSNNVIVIDAAGDRAGLADTIEVGEGPTGVAFDAARERVYVQNRFEGSLSVIDEATELEVARIPYFDPTPAAIVTGRVHLYGTHENSGLGQIACASCHVDARMDRLAWDLGDPQGEVKSVAGQNLGANLGPLAGSFEDWHPMKGPMTTQTMQDIIGKEPHHWRGDRDGLEEFAGAFTGLQGDDETLTAAEMQEYEDFLASVHFPPNPFRNFNNTLPTSLALPGHFTTGRFGPAGLPLPNGNAARGLVLFRPPNQLDVVACVTCHTLPTGLGTNHELAGTFGPYVPIPVGPKGERHHALVSVDGSTNVSMKIPHLRNQYDKVGFEATQTSNRAGFGFLHDGSVDSLARFVSEPVFSVQSNQDVADLVAFMLTFAGSELPTGSTTNLLVPPGPTSRDAHSAVGRQRTFASSSPPAADVNLVNSMITFANANKVGLVVKGRRAGEPRGWTYLGGGVFQSDRAAETHTLAALQAGAASASEITFTVVPKGSETRIGVDRDLDGFFDADELDAGSDPADPASVPCTASAPSAPTNLVALAVGKHEIVLTWLDVSANEDEFVVERRDPGADSVFQPIATLPAGSTAYHDGALPCFTKFAYRVSAVNCAASATSANASAKTLLCARAVLEPNPSVQNP